MQNVKVNCGVTAEYPSIWSYNPEKAGYIDTQLSPADALRTRNTYMSDHPSPSEFASKEMEWLRGYAVVKTTPPPRNLLVREWSGYAATQLWRPPLPLIIC